MPARSFSHTYAHKKKNHTKYMFHEALACIYTYTYYRKYMCRNQISFCSYVSQDRIFKFSYLNNYCKSVTDL